jgi:HAD superfamily hydrolase (TIGR01484 family)
VTIRLVLCDVDGTLLAGGSERVTGRVRAAVRSAVSAGLRIGFATGRTAPGVHPLVRDLGLREAWAVCNNGTVLARFADDVPGGCEIVQQATFDPAAAVAGLLRAIPGGIVASWREDTYLTTRLFPPGELVVQQEASLEEVLAGPVTKAVLRWPDRTSAEVLPLLEGVELPATVVGLPSRLAAWLDLVPATVSKASGAAALAEWLGVAPADVMAIGDDYNDIDLLRWAGRGVAMGGAPDAVLAAADEATASVTDDGLADVLESLVAGESSARSVLG